MRKQTVSMNRQQLAQLIINHCTPFKAGEKIDCAIYFLGPEDGTCDPDEAIEVEWVTFAFEAPDKPILEDR